MITTITNHHSTISSTLSKSELANLYSPNVAQSTALNRLARWIKGDPDLCVALRQAGYHDNQRIFTAKQVTIIYDYLGNPITEPEIRNIM